jgi:predicted nucleotidyltransferase
MNEISPFHIRGELFDQVIVALREVLGASLIAVVLYGSRAKGEAHDQSDWDLLLIAENLPEKPLARHFFLKRALPADCRGAISLLAKTPAEFEARVSPLYLDIALDGQILYDSRGYAATRLEKLKNLIDKSGLYRFRSKDGEMWKFTRTPSRPWSLSWE